MSAASTPNPFLPSASRVSASAFAFARDSFAETATPATDNGDNVPDTETEVARVQLREATRRCTEIGMFRSAKM